MNRDERWMSVALAEAERGLSKDELPIGAAVVGGDGLLAAAQWALRPDLRLVDHAELKALRAAEGTRRLGSAERAKVTLYTTLEPCLLCMGAASSFLAGRVVFAVEAPVDGAGDVLDRWAPALGHPRDGFPYATPPVIGGVCREESLALLRQFIARNPDAEFARRLVPHAARQ